MPTQVHSHKDGDDSKVATTIDLDVGEAAALREFTLSLYTRKSAIASPRTE